MLEILCKGFRGCERAELVVDPVVLIAGKNGMGKSSICQAVAAGLTGATIPFYIAARPDKPVLTKTEAKGLVRGGVDEGLVAIAGDVGAVKVKWPSHNVTSEGKPPAASKVATGLLNPLEFADVDRQKFMAGLLQADPSEQDLREALKDAGFDVSEPEEPDQIGLVRALWNRVQGQGWDPAHKAARELGAQLKGRWEGATGTDFGMKKAREWKPEGWNPAIYEAGLPKLTEDLADARQKVENAVGALAVDTAELERLAAQVQVAERLQATLSKAEGQALSAKQELEKADAEVKKTTVPDALACPHCGGLVQLDASKATPAVPTLVAFNMTKDERDTLRSQHEDACAKQKKAKEKYAKAAGEETNLRMQLAAVSGAAGALAAAKEKKGSQEAVDLARDLALSIEKHVKMVESYMKAYEQLAQLEDQQKVIDILAPDGLRRAKLSKALETFNNQVLAPLCVDAEYPAIAINEDLELVYGARRYYLLSASEQYRCRVVFQTAVAMRDGSALVILDGADILDDGGRNGLFSMLGRENLPNFLIAMTVNGPKRVPNLADAGMGRSYWIEDGRASELTTTQAAA